MIDSHAVSSQSLPVAVSGTLPEEVHQKLKSAGHQVEYIELQRSYFESDSKHYAAIVLCDSDRAAALKIAAHLRLPNTPCISINLKACSGVTLQSYSRLPAWISNDPMPENALCQQGRDVLHTLKQSEYCASTSPQPARLKLVTSVEKNKVAAESYVPRASICGKFLKVDGQPFVIKGVTYGTFIPNEKGDQYPDKLIVERDFIRMIDTGINTVRVYTPPPQWFLDLASAIGLFVMVGIPWEQHIAVLDDPDLQQDIKNRFSSAVKQCNSHPAILCYSIGNEIPASIIRWHGKKKVSAFLKSLYDIVKTESPAALVTYVNFPTTEFLPLDFVDFYSFNVYLESEEKLRSYVARIQHIAGSKPLVLAEVGLDSDRNGLQAQRDNLSWQLRSIFDCGAAGAFVFSWTDEWYVGGRTIEDWAFGITTTARQPKPALSAVKEGFADSPFSSTINWPSFSVVVCSYNGSATIRQTLDALMQLDYPDFEVIVVNDGSTDNTADIAAEYPVTLISTENKGLSSARNTGYQAGSGEIVAYIDDDAFPEPHWLRYLALGYNQPGVVSVGGPNYPVPNDVVVADCVANAPGGPMEVMLTDTIAEHIPGCNMSFKRSALDQIGGFDPQFRAAGDDVDLCWRIIDQVGNIGFHPAAFNWHRRRNTVKGYWKQQRGYGVAEALLEKKWPEKYNVAGYVSWSGRLYGQGFVRSLGFKPSRVYQGIWGSAPFQQNDDSGPGGIQSLTLMPEWVLLTATLFALSVLGIFWQPLLYLLFPGLITLGIWVAQSVNTALAGKYDVPQELSIAYLKRFILTGVLTFAQPMARLSGRLRSGLTATRIPGSNKSRALFSFPFTVSKGVWDGNYQDRLQRLQAINESLIYNTFSTRCGDQYQDWDLQVYGGLFGSCRLSLMVEHHKEQTDHVLYRLSQRWSTISWSLSAITIFYASIALLGNSPVIASTFLLTLGVIIFLALGDSARAKKVLVAAVTQNASAKHSDSTSQYTTEDITREEKHSVAA